MYLLPYASPYSKETMRVDEPERNLENVELVTEEAVWNASHLYKAATTPRAEKLKYAKNYDQDVLLIANDIE